jgi:hypothetical protein
MPHHDLMIDLGATRATNTRTVRVGDTFQIHYPGNGFTFRYTDAFPFPTTDSLDKHRDSGETQTATVAGPFPFDCFHNGNKIESAPGGPPVAGELIVDPQG